MESATTAWKLTQNDAQRLADLLGIDANDILVRETETDVEAPICHVCGRQIGLLDVANGAVTDSKHGAIFLTKFFCSKNLRSRISEEDLARLSEVEHKVRCIDCGERQNKKPKWNLMSGRWM